MNENTDTWLLPYKHRKAFSLYTAPAAGAEFTSSRSKKKQFKQLKQLKSETKLTELIEAEAILLTQRLRSAWNIQRWDLTKADERIEYLNRLNSAK